MGNENSYELCCSINVKVSSDVTIMQSYQSVVVDRTFKVNRKSHSNQVRR